MKGIIPPMKMLDAVKEYQCPGCVNDPAGTCYKKNGNPMVGCVKHTAGTRCFPYAGLIFLGMPKGFNRTGPCEHNMNFQIFENLDALNQVFSYDKFLDKHGNTMIRGLSPRMNIPFLHVVLGDVRSEIDCLELTNDDLKKMD